MEPDGVPKESRQRSLGPHVVGQRIVVRRVLRGETGPTGGPALTDVLGVCESWADGVAVVRRADGSTVQIAIADIVSGKPVPPRPSRFSRIPDDEVARRAAAILRPRESETHAGWVFRASGGSTARANSILAVGVPDAPVEDVVDRAREFFGAHRLPIVAQVVVGSAADHLLVGLGWVPFRSGAADTEVMLAGIAHLARRLDGVDTSAVELVAEFSPDWLTDRDLGPDDAARLTYLLGLDEVSFASVHRDGQQVARARANLSEDWALFADLAVHPDHRRRGWARAVTAALVEWAAEQGASVMLLQVRADNSAAQAMYLSLGFERHHSYRYLTPPS